MRRPELELSWPQIPILTVDDFLLEATESLPIAGSTKFRNIRRIPGLFLTRTGLISSCNRDSEFKNVRRFVKQFRGHYSYRTITPWVLTKMSNDSRLNDSILISQSNSDSTHVSLHYRLGDLLTLTTKKPLESERLSTLLKSITEEQNVNEIHISSDSPDVVQNRLNLSGSSHCKVINGDALYTIQQMQQGCIFIGTNSKISLWITLIRIYFQHHKVSWMPKEMMGHLVHNVENSLLQKYVRFY
jgi:hypothetical protein